VDPVVEHLHGVEVADPYRWLEAGGDDEVRDWVADQNRHTRAVLGALPGRDALRARLSALLHAGSSMSCTVAGDRVFSVERWGHHDQAVLVVRSATATGMARTLVDPHAATGDPTAALDWYRPAPDGRYVAYGLSRGGDERSTLHLLDVETGEPVGERIPNTRACSIAWLPDGSAFAYTRYPEPATLPEAEHGYWRTGYWHRIGEDWHADELVWGDLPDRAAWPNVELSPDGRWLILHVSLGWSRVDVHLLDRVSGAWTVLIQGVDAVSSFSVVGDELIGLTTHGAARGRIVAAPVRAGWVDNWCTIVPESDRVLEAVVATADSLLVAATAEGVSHLDRHDHAGAHLEPVPLPGVGSLAGLDGSLLRDEAFFSFTSFAQPPTTYRWRPTGVEDWSRLGSHEVDGVGPAGTYVVEQVHYPSTDGVAVPLFLVRAAGTEVGPDTPTLLTGYGGFAVTLGPAYSAAVVAVCDAGGVYAVAGVRGGSERGEAWHRAGMREHKQQAFDDLVAAAEWLVRQGRTDPGRLALRGGSNGGLLMGAVLTQRPDVCAAVQVAVPLLDMVRYHRFLIARLWIPEYGDPEDPEEFRWVWGYSPYHRVRDGTCYPAVLLTTAEEDSRVDPLHARKMAARLQAATACGDRRPVLLREEERAGHGQGKPVSKQADELADVLAFLAWQLAWDIVPDPAAG
jgi:prolyl oligopeptidase